jgi:hypothetical protein
MKQFIDRLARISVAYSAPVRDASGAISEQLFYAAPGVGHMPELRSLLGELPGEAHPRDVLQVPSAGDMTSGIFPPSLSLFSFPFPLPSYGLASLFLCGYMEKR